MAAPLHCSLLLLLLLHSCQYQRQQHFPVDHHQQQQCGSCSLCNRHASLQTNWMQLHLQKQCSRPPHAICSIGFGGRPVTMHPLCKGRRRGALLSAAAACGSALCQWHCTEPSSSSSAVVDRMTMVCVLCSALILLLRFIVVISLCCCSGVM